MYVSLDKNYKIHHNFFFTAYMVSQNAFPKSSAKHLAPRRFSQKGFDISIFGHRSCPFSGIFLTLVQIRIEEITNLIYEIIGKKREHNGLTFLMGEKSDFLDRNIWTCDTQLLQKMPIFVLKPK